MRPEDLLFGDEDYTYIDIVVEKYIFLSVGTLRGLCTKFDIPFYFGETKKTLALQSIPKAFCSDGFLQGFYQALPLKEQRVLRFIVNYQGTNVAKAVKKAYGLDIVLNKKSDQIVYVWWLELFLHNNSMDTTLRSYFLEFLGDEKTKRTPIAEADTPASVKDIERLTIDKFTFESKPLSQHLEVIGPSDAISTIRIFYTLAKESKIKVTQKGALTVRSDKLLNEHLSVEEDHYVWLINFFMSIKYLTQGQVKLPTKAFDTTMIQDDGESIKTIFETFIDLRVQYEFRFVIFHNTISKGNTIHSFRKSILKIIKEQKIDEWISLDYIVDQIKIDNQTLKLISNGSRYCYGFSTNRTSFHIAYDRIDDLKVVIRYFIKSFIGILNRLGICSIAQTSLPSYCEEDLETLDIQYESPFTNIEYFRSSDLGGFALGLKKDFSAVGTSDFRLRANPYALEVKVDHPSTVSDLFLANIFKRSGDEKYKTDIKTFMQNIDSPAQYEQIKRSFIAKAGDLPNNWERFFDTIDARVDMAATLSNSAVLIQIKNNKEVLKSLSNDLRLKDKVLKADRLHIVVLKHELAYVKKIFREYGVLL